VSKLEDKNFMYFEDLPYQTQQLLLDLIVSIVKNMKQDEQAEESEEPIDD
jgi:hypothetical protein